uniref:Vg_2 protein n=1 Tax=Fopius arisanus TaxID=64838 RepID=A0A0C9QJQ8_9HYME
MRALHALFLTPEMYGLEYSTAVIMDNYLKEMSIGYAGQISWIYGEDSAMPQGIYKAFDASYGGIKVPKDETGIMVSSVKDFYKNMKRLLKNFIDEKKDHPMKMKGKSPTEAVVEMLDIEGKKKDKFEMFFLSRDMYSSSYFVMGEDMLNPIPEEYIRLAAKSLKSGKSFNMMSLQNFEVAVGFPLATGLPFTGEFQMPRLRQLSGKMKISTGSDLPIGSASKLDKMIAAMDIRMVISQKGQSRFGFVTPFDGTQYVTGTDKNIHFHIPMSAKVNCDVAKKEIRMKLMPMNKNKAVKMVHWSAMPFTARKNIEDLKPTASMGNPGMMIMKKDEEEQSMTIIGSEKRGLSFKITETKSGESSSVLEKMTDLDTIWQNVLFPMVDRKVEPYSIDVLSIPSPSSDPEINFVVGWDTMSKNELSDNSSEMSHRWMSKPEIIEPLDKDLASPFRKREMMKEALKELPAADAVAVDIALELPGEDKMNYIMTTALATSKINEKFKALVYMRSGGTQKAWEACATAQGSSPAVPPFEPEMMESEKLQRGMDIKIGIGISCKSGVQSVLHARQWQSKEFQEAIHKNKKMYESMGIPKTLMDRATIIVHEADEEMDKWEKHPKNMKRLIGNSKALHQLVSNFESQTNSEDERNERYVRLDGSIEPGTKKLRLDLKAPMMGLDYTASTELIPGILPMMLLESDATYGSGYIKKIGRRGSVHKSIPPEDVCLIEKDFVTTFDGLEYPLELSKCWCIAVTSVPEQESKLSKPAIESDKQTSITIRKDESDDSKREISVTLGSEEIQMTKPNSEIMVKINRKMIDWSSNEYLIKEGEDDELVIVKLPGEAVSIESEKYGLKIIFDGRRTLIEMDDKYRDSVRGLCGNFDSESSNDLLTPHNRLSPKPQDFASLYVLPEKECQSSSKGVREMEKSLPVDKPRLTDVVSDREAGRPNHHGKWGSSDPFSSRYSKKTQYDV